MASTSLRLKDKLDGATNFLSLKVRITLLLEENDLWDIVKDFVPSLIELQQLAAHKKRKVKAKWMIIDVVKDHLIPRPS
jgi:predicted oxidoreductase (fatty acid repression mutant protein)